MLWALTAFIAFAVVVLTRASAMLEPDDYAYRASIVALSHGQIFLSNAQFVDLKASLATSGPGTLQWHHMASGYWISEKNPGYPFFAVLFYALGLLRLTPLFYGALACAGIFIGVRRWVSESAAAIAVWIYCFSGAALTFAWRSTMPSFSDASLIAAGFGLLIWVLVAGDASARRRRWVGLAGFVALECAVFIRYTNIFELLVAVVTMTWLARSARLRFSDLVVWATSVGALGVVILGFNQWAYGSVTSTGYSSGEISFSLSSFWPNFKAMPAQLTTAMPMWLLAAAAVVVMVVRFVRTRGSTGASTARSDVRIGAFLAVGWLTLWIFYFFYSWTVTQLSGGPTGPTITVHVIRFYLPALGLIAMLAAWLVDRFARPAVVATIGVLAIAALFSFQLMSSSPSGGGPLGAVPGHVVPNGAGPNGAGPNGAGHGRVTGARPSGLAPALLSGVGAPG
ncbi:MAG: hypothetical protein PXZ08_01065 [Actinomycetota bacterium]|nr:hypothetical protein [Actinomycetota bacterium]